MSAQSIYTPCLKRVPHVTLAERVPWGLFQKLRISNQWYCSLDLEKRVMNRREMLRGFGMAGLGSVMLPLLQACKDNNMMSNSNNWMQRHKSLSRRTSPRRSTILTSIRPVARIPRLPATLRTWSLLHRRATCSTNFATSRPTKRQVAMMPPSMSESPLDRFLF